MAAEIGWTHNVVIMDKCKKKAECEFYVTMTKKFGWTKNVLIHHIENQSLRKRLLTRRILIKLFRQKYENKQNWL